MKTLTQDPISSGQLKLITRMIGDIPDSKDVQDALSSLSKESAERLKGSELVSVVRQFVIEKITEFSVTDKFADEEVESKYGYLSGYKPQGQMSELNAQMNQLRGLFSGLGFCNEAYWNKIEKGEIKLPQNAEGWFAIPNWMKNPKIFGTTYSEAVQKVLDVIKSARKGKFYNYREGQINESRLRQSARSVEYWKQIAEVQGDADILLIPAQFGVRHRGRSVRRAREVMISTSGEFGLGAFAVGIMILTHPNRLQHYDDLWIDCAGDEFDVPVSAVRFDSAPYFRFRDDEVKFDTKYVVYVNDDYGAASGFSPQLTLVA